MRLRECERFCFLYEQLIAQVLGPEMLSEFEKEAAGAALDDGTRTVLYQFPPAVRLHSSHTKFCKSEPTEVNPTHTPAMDEADEQTRQQIISETQAKYQNLTPMHADHQFGHQEGEGMSAVHYEPCFATAE